MGKYLRFYNVASRYEEQPTCGRAPEVSSSVPRRGREGEGERGVGRVRDRTAGARESSETGIRLSHGSWRQSAHIAR